MDFCVSYNFLDDCFINVNREKKEKTILREGEGIVREVTQESIVI